MINIPRLERKYIPNLRKRSYYKVLKLIILVPPAIPIYYLHKGLQSIIKLVRFKRKNKPDIVLENIIAGWTNLVLYDAVVEKTALHRANICAQCPSAEFSGGIHTAVIDNRTTNIRGLKCTECGCPLSAKVRSNNDYCPLGKW